MRTATFRSTRSFEPFSLTPPLLNLLARLLNVVRGGQIHLLTTPVTFHRNASFSPPLRLILRMGCAPGVGPSTDIGSASHTSWGQGREGPLASGNAAFFTVPFAAATSNQSITSQDDRRELSTDYFNGRCSVPQEGRKSWADLVICLAWQSTSATLDFRVALALPVLV